MITLSLEVSLSLSPCWRLGGTAGCVVANRLSANPDVNVLLLERGDVRDYVLYSCGILSFPPFGFLASKEIKLAPQEALPKKMMSAYEGLVLGGRTRINGGLYLQGCPEEYKDWGKGWQWDDVAPAFSRFESRLELEDTQNPCQEGGELKTRIIKAEFESSQKYTLYWHYWYQGSPKHLDEWGSQPSKRIVIRRLQLALVYIIDVISISMDDVVQLMMRFYRNLSFVRGRTWRSVWGQMFSESYFLIPQTRWRLQGFSLKVIRESSSLLGLSVRSFSVREQLWPLNSFC